MSDDLIPEEDLNPNPTEEHIEQAEAELEKPPGLTPAEPDIVPTQVAYRLRAVLRSVTQVLVGAAFDWLLNTLPAFQFLMDELAKEGLDRGSVVSTVSAGVFIVGTSGAVWVMNNVKVDKFLTMHLNFGARPRDAYIPEHAFPEGDTK